MIVEEDRKGGIQCQVTSSTHEKKSRTNVIVKNGKYYLKHNTLQDVCILIVGRDQRVLQSLHEHELTHVEYFPSLK
jgi:DNA-directed RNA polymerase III subunit RPC2